MTETAADEQDLAKALDSVASTSNAFGSSNDVTNSINAPVVGGSDFPPIVMPGSPVAPTLAPLTPPSDSTIGSSVATPLPIGLSDPSNGAPILQPPVTSDPTDDVTLPSPANSPVDSGPLADIKRDALTELRPLVDKLNVSPEEKFDTLLLLIRSTDDSSLIASAHESAKAIADETRRAEALLDIIKEIDYLSHQNAPENPPQNI